MSINHGHLCHLCHLVVMAMPMIITSAMIFAIALIVIMMPFGWLMLAAVMLFPLWDTPAKTKSPTV